MCMQLYKVRSIRREDVAIIWQRWWWRAMLMRGWPALGPMYMYYGRMYRYTHGLQVACNLRVVDMQGLQVSCEHRTVIERCAMTVCFPPSGRP